MNRFSPRIRFLVIALTASVAVGRSAADTPPDARALIERHEKEKSPVWADGDTATFFYRGEAEQVMLLVAGDNKMLARLPGSDVWTATYSKPGLARGVFTYAILPGKKGESLFGKK